MTALEQLQHYVEYALSRSQAETASVAALHDDSFDLRFAVNTVTTCGAARALSLHITSTFGKRSGSASTSDLSNEGIERAVKHSEELARLAPENPEFMPPLGKGQKYLDITGFDEATAKLSPAEATEQIAKCLLQSRQREIELAGFFSVGTDAAAIGNSNGLRAAHRASKVGFSTTARTYEGRGSNKVQRASFKISDLQLEQLASQAIDRAFLARNPVELAPGQYTAILEPSACADMVGFFFFNMDRRAADEGRSFFSEPDGKTKIGQQLFPEQVSIHSDPQHTAVPSYPWGTENLPFAKTTWIEKGRFQNMFVERFWAEKNGLAALAFPPNILMTGTSKSISDLVASTERGILVTNLWYIRDVDPQKLLITGLTRDGLFLVEDGKVKHPIKNFRFNESPANVLKSVTDIGTPTSAVGNETQGIKFHVPAIKVSSFNFSTLSDAV